MRGPVAELWKQDRKLMRNEAEDIFVEASNIAERHITYWQI